MKEWQAALRRVVGRLGGWKAALLVGLAVGLVVLWAVLRARIEKEDATWERVVKTGVVAVCTDPSWPPFEFVDELTGEVEGFDVAVAREVAARLAPGVRAQTVSVAFDGLYDALLASRCDAVVSALPYEPMRSEDVSYSVAYYNAGLVIAIRTGGEGVERLEELEGRVVGVEWGFVPEGDARQREVLLRLAPRRYNTAGDVLRALDAGEVEVALVDRITALAYARECGGIEIVGEPLNDLNYVVAVRPKSFRLLREINRALLEMRQDGTIEGLQETWF